jgi:hypothetical protein
MVLTCKKYILGLGLDLGLSLRSVFRENVIFNGNILFFRVVTCVCVCVYVHDCVCVSEWLPVR